MTTIAVTFPIYGSFDHRRLRLALESCQRQNRHLELIVSEQNTEPWFESEARTLGIKYIFSPTEMVDGQPLFNTGRIRNDALKLVTADLVYTADADIVFLNPAFFSRLHQALLSSSDLVFYHAPLRRLPLNCFNEFEQNVNMNGLASALEALHAPNEYLATTRPENVELKIVTGRNGRVYTTETDVFQRYKSDPTLRGWEPTIWFEIVHCGSTLARMSQIEAVGRYAECYVTWGYEDSDLLWKLGELFKLQKIPREKEYEVLHLDHPKGYFSKDANIQNMALFEQRKQKGIHAVILSDKGTKHPAGEGKI